MELVYTGKMKHIRTGENGSRFLKLNRVCPVRNGRRSSSAALLEPFFA